MFVAKYHGARPDSHDFAGNPVHLVYIGNARSISGGGNVTQTRD